MRRFIKKKDLPLIYILYIYNAKKNIFKLNFSLEF